MTKQLGAYFVDILEAIEEIDYEKPYF